MKTFKIVFWIILIFRLGASAQNDISQAKWAAKKIIADGNTKEWDKPLNFYSPDIGQMYSISNDSTYLFLCFISGDPLKIRKLILAGWEIELSSKVKNNKFNSVIIFPPAKNNDEENKDNIENRRNMGDQNKFINTYKIQLSGVIAKGFKTKNGNLPLIDQGGINIGVGSDSLQNLCYELAIPLKELLAESPLQLNEMMILTVKVNGLSSSPGGKNREGVYDGRSGGRNYERGNYGGGQNSIYGGMNGGMYGGRPGGGNYQEGQYGGPGAGERNELFQNGKAKQKFVLTKK